MIIFWIKEAFKLIGRAKTSFFLSLISTSIAIVLIVSSVFAISLSLKFQKSIKEQVSLNIFLKENSSKQDIEKLKEKLKSDSHISKVNFINKNEAAKIFIRETGEDFRKILDYNPLPESFTISLKDNFVQQDSINKLIKYYSSFDIVEEIGFNQSFVYKLISYLDEFKKYILLITSVLFFISLYIVYSTIKLVISSKYNELETMKLVGAKLSTIKMPIILNGVLIGFLSGVLALSFISGGIYVLGSVFYLKRFILLDGSLYLIITLSIGPLIGFIVSYLSLRKITLKI